MPTSLLKIPFDNSFAETFPGDGSGALHPRQTPNVLYSKVVPTAVASPVLLAWSDALGQQLGIARPQGPEEVAVLAGNKVTATMQPYAARYAGHQFGNWAGQLGDGRAITLGEVKAPDGAAWELQLKGAGPTPYSRRADGRAVLRSSVREYLMSEAMHYLGVPTTRALSLVATGEPVLRDMFYDGHPAHEPGAIVLRVSPSFLRFGSFEMLAAQNEVANLESLTRWTIHRFFPQLKGEQAVLRFFREVVDRTAALVVEWLRVGFVHGVMNTDNMSILGLTIDYGPYSFVDAYDPAFTPNTTDLPGRRYAFGRQPSVAYWNLSCLAGALLPLFPGEKELTTALHEYESLLVEKYRQMMTGKLGLDHLRAGDETLFEALENALTAAAPDMTIFYQQLITWTGDADEAAWLQPFEDAFYTQPGEPAKEALLTWLRRYRERRMANEITVEESREKMRRANPRFILRNYLLHQAIEGLQQGDATLFHTLEAAIKEPYGTAFDQFFTRRPDWASSAAGCSMLSCSS